MQEVGSQNIKDVKLQSPVFTGIVIRERWGSVAPTASTYNWAFSISKSAGSQVRQALLLAIYTVTTPHSG